MKNSRKMFILIEGLLAVLLVTVFLAMVRERKPPEQKKISAIVSASDDSQWAAFQYGLRMAAQDFGIDLTVVKTQGDLWLEEEQRLIKREMENGADAVIVQPAPYPGTTKMLEKMARQLPIMLVEDNGAAEGEETALPYTAPDNYGMGKALALELLLDYSGTIQGKTIGIVLETTGSGAAEKRLQGFLDAVEGKGGKVLWSLPKDQEMESSILKEQPGVDFVVALDDKSVVQAGAASEANDLHGALVYGIGNSTEAVYYLDSDAVQCLVVPDEFNVGYQSLAEAADSSGSFYDKMESQTVSHTVLRREELFFKENQEILFTMNQ